MSEDFVSFTKKNLNYLLRENYDESFIKYVYERPVVTYEELRRGQIPSDGPVRIQYNTKDQYKRLVRMLGLMDDFKVSKNRSFKLV